MVHFRMSGRALSEEEDGVVVMIDAACGSGKAAAAVMLDVSCGTDHTAGLVHMVDISCGPNELLWRSDDTLIPKYCFNRHVWKLE